MKAASNPKRHHFVPRLLLRRFASRVNRKKNRTLYYIFAHDQTTGSFETNVDNIALESGFYGQFSEGLEPALSAVESDFASTLDHLDRTGTVDAVAPTISGFMWLQALRTRTFRANTVDVIRRGVHALSSEVQTAQAKQHLKTRGIEIIDEEIARRFASASPQARAFARLVARQAVARGVDSGRLPGQISAFLGALAGSGVLETTLPDAHNKALLRGLASMSAPQLCRSSRGRSSEAGSR